MSILRKLSDVLQEVFWIKPSKKKFLRSRRAPAKKAPKKKFIKPRQGPARTLPFNLVKVGEITHYFDRIKVCVIKVTQGTILIGDRLTIVGPKVQFIQKVWSMQIESEDVKVAKKGQLIGLKIDKPVRVGDMVYK